MVTPTDFPQDEQGRPLAWPDPHSDGFVDAWNGWYPSRAVALRESQYWTASAGDRVLAHGEGLTREWESRATTQQVTWLDALRAMHPEDAESGRTSMLTHASYTEAVDRARAAVESGNYRAAAYWAGHAQR